MAGDNLTIDLAPSLREALAIPDATSLIDYYVLLGLPRGSATAEAINAAVMARTKALRPWQNSADYGPEVVKLLPMLHRVATILKDPVRSEAYREQLDRLVSGEKADPREDGTVWPPDSFSTAFAPHSSMTLGWATLRATFRRSMVSRARQTVAKLPVPTRASRRYFPSLEPLRSDAGGMAMFRHGAAIGGV